VVADAPQAPDPAPAAPEALMDDYGTWMRTRCGSAPGTITPRRRKVRGLPAFRFGGSAPGDLNAITRAGTVARSGAAGDTDPVGGKSRADAPRSPFRFMFATGRTERNPVPRGPVTAHSASVRSLSYRSALRLYFS